MSNISMSDAELLKFAIENGMLDTALVQERIEMQKRKEILNKHPYTIWEGKNGKWYTYLPSTNDERKLIKRNLKVDIEKTERPMSAKYSKKSTGGSVKVSNKAFALV